MIAFANSLRCCAVAMGLLFTGCYKAGVDKSAVIDKAIEPVTRLVVSRIPVDLNKESAMLLCGPDATISEEAFRELSVHASLIRLVICRATIESGSLVHIKQLPNLKEVSLLDMTLAKRDLEILQGMTQVRWISLRGSQLPLQAEVIISEMHHLEFLDITNTNMTSEAVEAVRRQLTGVELQVK
jgi:hypothetical protein